jgi:hypothetical protein
MLHPTTDQWQQWGITEPHHRFFFLRWHELFDNETFDTWQIRSSNIRSMLDELDQSARILKVAYNHHPNIEALLDEIDTVLEHDRVLRYRLPIVIKTIAELRNWYNQRLQAEQLQAVDEFIRNIHITLSYLSNYATMLFDDVEAILEQAPDKYKIELHQLTMLLGMELKNKGHSIEALRQSVEVLRTKSAGEFLSRFRRMRGRLLEKGRRFGCVFLVRGPGRFDSIPDDSVNHYEMSETRTSTEDEFWGQDTGDGVNAVQCEVFASDVFSARRIAQQRLEEILAYWRVYRPSKEHTVHEKAMVLAGRDEQVLISESDGLGIATPSDARSPDTKAAELIGNLSYMRREHTRHVGAALQYFRLYLYARKQEAKLINLWIALEALFQDVGRGSLIGRATSSVSTIMALNYVQDVARAVAVDIRNVWRHARPTQLADSLPQSSARLLHSDDFMTLITASTTSELWSDFVRLFEANPLMVFRLWKLRNGLFKSPEAMAHRIEDHRRNVAWQIQRIYRLRNMIAHQGTAPMDISQLIGHLQTYFVTTFHDIVHTTKHRRLQSLGEALESRARDFTYLQDRLTKNAAKPIPVRLVATGFAESDGSETRLLWQDNQ